MDLITAYEHPVRLIPNISQFFGLLDRLVEYIVGDFGIFWGFWGFMITLLVQILSL